ncbi:sensor histidine kinase [Aridibaculum aurantiacum]|uniref:sensor histidine kinase n=1 Tax=Aridibaculum aurantiacum TaxID=2810307 RepID=UPI001A95763F|nr:histidine kinase [Aridibaculum aurantiacum]
MESYQFIFSDKHRLKRHILFWISWWIFSTLLYGYSAAILPFPLHLRLLMSMTDSLFFLVPQAFMSYTLMYFVVPQQVLKHRYVLALITVIAVALLTAFSSAVIGLYVLHPIKKLFVPDLFPLNSPRGHNATIFLSVLAGLRGGLTIGGMAASIKIMKHLYLKEQRNMQLQKENIQSQLQVLKAQVHPHFLFNTLNNIFSHTQQTSPVASQLVMGLSDMLRYMLYEGNKPLVLLANEIKMLEDYIMVEKIRYGNKLEVNFQIDDNIDHLAIAPLILLPFVENSFKHGASQMLDQPWVSLSLHLEGENMHFKLINGKAPNYQAPKTSSGIGIQNVQRRLELLYPDNHLLKIQDEEEVFIVDLKLRLTKMAVTTKPKALTKTPVYE